MNPITYKQAGVDPEKAAAILSRFARFQKSRPQDPRVVSGIGPFASCFSIKDLLGDYSDPLLVTCCDGVGTKLKLALDWNRLDGIGHDLVAMNINDLLCLGARPLVFLDYYACGSLDETQLMRLLKSIQSGCEIACCTLVGGETAEMPGLYQNADFDLAGFAAGLVDRNLALGSHRVQKGDTILGLPSSGFHSNGYSLVRTIVEKEKLKGDGQVPFGNETWAEALLKPTIIYTSAIRPIAKRVHALAHLTGGGLFENLPRIIPPDLTARVDPARWNFPPLFQWIQEHAQLSQTQMLSTFNCGFGMLIVVSAEDKLWVQTTLENSGYLPQDLGEVSTRITGQNEVTFG